MDKIKLNENETKCIEVLVSGFDRTGWEEDRYYNFNGLAKVTGLDRKKVRLACRSLTRKGLAQYMRGLWSDYGPAGAGYGATEKAAAMLCPCDICGELASYEYDGKRECQEHYGKDRSTLFHEVNKKS